MSRTPVSLVTGAGGEIGHGLIHGLAAHGGQRILALDLKPVHPDLAKLCVATRAGSITDTAILKAIGAEFEIEAVYHLAALLSTRSERNPGEAHEVNVGGTLNLLELGAEQAKASGRVVKFFFPSSIAVYGMPDLETKRRVGAVREHEWLQPATMYGCNKLYCEHLGRYYADHYKRLDADAGRKLIDFRGIRFPGLISAETVPTGGTSDYGPEMIHAAAQGKDYPCFVREDSRIAFMAMPDAVAAIQKLMAAPAGKLSLPSYNISAFAPSAADFARLVQKSFPAAKTTFKPDVKRQGIVDSWPEDTVDEAARRDWDFTHGYDFERTFFDYLLPNIKRRYGGF